MSGISFLDPPEPTPAAQRMFDEDVVDMGFVMNVTRVWAAFQPDLLTGLFDLMQTSISVHRLSLRQRGILVTACASALGDSYCALAWGTKLAKESDAQTAAGVLRGDDGRLSASEKALAHWARRVARGPNHTSQADVRALRDAGFSDAQIFSVTVFVALRVTLSTVNDALGVRPDAAYRDEAPDEVLGAVTYGRPIED